MRMIAYLTGDSNIAASKVAVDEPVRCLITFTGSRRELLVTVGHDGALGVTWDPKREPSDTTVWHVGQLSFPDVESDDPEFEILIPQRQ